MRLPLATEVNYILTTGENIGVIFHLPWVIPSSGISRVISLPPKAIFIEVSNLQLVKLWWLFTACSHGNSYKDNKK